MNIGEEKKEITFEPVEAPAEQPVTPEPVPVEPVPDTEPVPVGLGYPAVSTHDVPVVEEFIGV